MVQSLSRPPCPPPEKLCVHPSAPSWAPELLHFLCWSPCHPTDLSLSHAAPLFQPNEQLPCSTSLQPLFCCFLFFIPGDSHHPLGSAEFGSGSETLPFGGGDTLCHGHWSFELFLLFSNSFIFGIFSLLSFVHSSRFLVGFFMLLSLGVFSFLQTIFCQDESYSSYSISRVLVLHVFPCCLVSVCVTCGNAY